MISLSVRIVSLALIASTLVCLPLAAWIGRSVQRQAERTRDARLVQMSRTVSEFAAALAAADAGMAPAPVRTSSVRVGGEDARTAFQYWNSGNVLLLGSDVLRDVGLDDAPAGFANVRVGQRRWRMYTQLDSDRHWVRVGEVRRDVPVLLLMAAAAAPWILGLPLLGFAVGSAVRNSLDPVEELTDRLRRYHVGSGDPVAASESVRELDPLVAALNGLLSRTQRVLETERDRTESIASELRALLDRDGAAAASAGPEAVPPEDRLRSELRRILGAGGGAPAAGGNK
jgi:hypothetical protein